MKLANAPGRLLTRQRGALARYPNKASQHHDGSKGRARTVDEYTHEYDTLLDLCTLTDEQARGIRTKKDRTSRAKIGRNA